MTSAHNSWKFCAASACVDEALSRDVSLALHLNSQHFYHCLGRTGLGVGALLPFKHLLP